MAKSAPDYSNVRSYGPMERLDDDGELAARLGSIVTFQRGGRVVFLDDFSTGINKWDDTSYGTGASVAPTVEVSKSKGFCCKMVAGSDGSAAAKIVKRLPYPDLNSFGVEVSFVIEAHTDYIDIVLSRMDGTNEHTFYVRYSVDDETLSIKDTSGNYEVVISDLVLTAQATLFHTIKLIAGLEEDEFIGVFVNETWTSLEDKPAYVFAQSDSPHVRVDVKLWGEAGYNAFSYFDDIIITQAEH